MLNKEKQASITATNRRIRVGQDLVTPEKRLEAFALKCMRCKQTITNPEFSEDFCEICVTHIRNNII